MSLYLSRLFLNPRQHTAASDLRNAYSMHQTLRWAFVGAGEPQAALPAGERILWRNDDERGVLVQSVSRPNWEAVAQRHPQYFAAPPQQKYFELDGLRAGQLLAFRLRANVTVSRYRNDQDRSADPRTKRQALRGATEQVQWLERQGEHGGFALLGADIAQSGSMRLYKKRGARPMTLFAVTFEGVLRVQDPHIFAQTVQSGIGKAKSLGFGLLSVARYD